MINPYAERGLPVPTPYCLGFVFSPDFTHVVLVQKLKPDWQRGKLNGIGGHVEPGESGKAAMHREANEEAGLPLDQQWVSVGFMGGPKWSIDLFATTHTPSLGTIQSRTDEPVGWYSLDQLPATVVPNLRWLVPLCLEKLLLAKYPSMEQISDFTLTYK